MAAKILQIIRPLEKVVACYINKWILEKDPTFINIFFEGLKAQKFNFPADLKEIAKSYLITKVSLLNKTPVPVFALIERGKKTSVEPLHLSGGGLFISDDIEGYLGMIDETSEDSEATELEFKIKALEYLRDGS